MRAPVMKAMGFVMANGTVLVAAHTISLGLGGNRSVRSSAEDLGVMLLISGGMMFVAEALGALQLVQARIASRKTTAAVAPHADTVPTS